MPKVLPLNILLIDDHRMFNDSLKGLLNTQPDLNVCGQVFHPDEVAFALKHHHPDLVLLDLNLPPRSGMDIGKEILASHPSTKILILTMYDQPKLLEEARRAGFQGYLLKEASAVELLEGIRTVGAGGTYFDPHVAPLKSPPDDRFDNEFARRANLTFREVEIIRLIREGLTNEQMAERLHVSFYTIKTHRRNIHFKLGISNVAELVQFATKYGM